MLKSLIKGIIFGVGFIAGIYICSKITLLGFGGSIKEFATSIGNMFIQLGT